MPVSAAWLNVLAPITATRVALLLADQRRAQLNPDGPRPINVAAVALAPWAAVAVSGRHPRTPPRPVEGLDGAGPESAGGPNGGFVTLMSGNRMSGTDHYSNVHYQRLGCAWRGEARGYVQSPGLGLPPICTHQHV